MATEENNDELILTEIKTQTGLKAWLFTYKEKWYQVSCYSGHKVPNTGSIWLSNAKGKRLKPSPIFSCLTSDPLVCVENFLDEVDAGNIVE